MTGYRPFRAAQLYGFARRDEPVELVNLWVSEEMDVQAVRLPRTDAADGPPSPARSRRVIFDGRACETAIYDRSAFGAGSRFTGPAIVEQDDSTTVVLPDQAAQVDDHGQILLETR